MTICFSGSFYKLPLLCWQVGHLYERQAKSNQDFEPVESGLITIANKEVRGLIPITILDDPTPELAEQLMVKLIKVWNLL